MNSKKAITLLVLATLVMAMVPVMPVQAISTPANTLNTALAVDNAGVYGDTQAVTGDGVTPGFDVQVYWDSVTAWDGKKGLLNSSAAEASGDFEVWFDVPESTVGNHYVWVRDTNSGENKRVTAAFVVSPSVELSSSSGLEDDKVDVEMYGYQDEADVAIILKKATVLAGPITTEALGASASPTLVYTFTLANMPVVDGGSVLVEETGSDGTFADTVTSGTLTYTPSTGTTPGVASGTIDYITGEIVLTYTTLPLGPAITGWTADYAIEQVATAVTGEGVGTTANVATAQSFSLDQNLVVPGSVSIADGTVTWTDPGLKGVLTPSAGAHTGSINYLTGDIVLTYTAGPGAVALTGAYGYYADKQDVTNILSSGAETNDLGSLTKQVTIPDESSEMAYGSYTVVTYDGKGNTVSEAFQIGAVISLDVDEGPVGTRVEITGSGFDDAQTIVEAEVKIAKDSAGTGAVALPIYDFDTSEIISNGGFTFEVVIPSVDMDDYDTIIITETGAGDTASASFDILGEASIEVTPGHGTQGSTVLVEGWNFTGGEEVVLSLGAGEAGKKTYDVDSDGTFEVSYTIPAVSTGTHDLNADQADYSIDADTEFRAGIMIVILSPTSGPSGTKVSITGTGFTNGGDWNATFGDDEWQSDKSETATEISSELYVPTIEAGVYTVSVYDISAEITVEVEFEVTGTTYVEADPMEAPAGFDITLEGYYFAEDYVKGDIEIILYNATHEWEAGDLGWATPVDDDWDDGYFENDFTLPDEDEISVGTYTLNVTSGEGMEAQLVFKVVEKIVDIDSRKPEFQIGDTLAFDVESSFTIDDSYIEISEPNGNLYWSTDEFDDDAPNDVWLAVGNIQRVLYSNQVSGGNPMVFLEDAPLGTWTWEYIDPSEDDPIDTGAFTLTAAAADVIGGQVTDLANQLEALSADLSGVTEDFNDVKSDISGVLAVAQQAVAAANAATEAVNAVATQANNAGAAAEAAQVAAENAAEAASGLTTLVYGAIGAALVAALAAIVSLMQISRRIAG